MAVPITWRNVNGPNLADAASRPLEAAQRSFNAAFAGIGGMLQQSEAVDAANHQNQRGNNTQAFLSKLSEQFKTPEALQAAMASGEVDKLKASFGPNIDQAAVRGAAESLLTQRAQQAQQIMGYENAMKDNRSLPFMQAFKAAAIKGDKAAMARAEADYVAVGGRDLAGLVGFADTRQQEEISRKREGIQFDRQGRKFNQDILESNDRMATNAIQRESASQNITLQKDQMTALQEQRKAQKAASFAAAQRQGLIDAGNLYAEEGIYTGKQSGDLVKLMNEAGVGDDASERLAVLGRFKSGKMQITSPDGRSKIEVPIPLAALKAAILSSQDEKANKWNQGWANTAEENLRAILQQHYTENGVAHSKAAMDLAAYNQTLSNALKNPRQR